MRFCRLLREATRQVNLLISRTIEYFPPVGDILKDLVDSVTKVGLPVGIGRAIV